MAKQSKRAKGTEESPSLAISPDKVCYIVLKAREFGVKDVVTEPDTGSNPIDDKGIAVLEDARGHAPTLSGASSPR
jgi:hypothetical protein